MKYQKNIPYVAISGIIFSTSVMLFSGSATLASTTTPVVAPANTNATPAATANANATPAATPTAQQTAIQNGTQMGTQILTQKYTEDAINGADSGPQQIPPFSMGSGIRIFGAIWEKGAGKVIYQIRCESCKTTQYETLNVGKVKDLKSIIMMIKADVQSKISIPVEKDSSNINEPFVETLCDSVDGDGGNISDVISCQKSELKDIVNTCLEDSNDQNSGDESQSDNASSCALSVKAYFHKFVKPVLKTAFSATNRKDPEIRSAGQDAVKMMLSGKIIPLKYISGDLNREVHSLSK